MDIKTLYGEWLEERRKSRKPPLPQDAHIYMAAFIEWAENRPQVECEAKEFDMREFEYWTGVRWQVISPYTMTLRTRIK